MREPFRKYKAYVLRLVIIRLFLCARENNARYVMIVLSEKRYFTTASSGLFQQYYYLPATMSRHKDWRKTQEKRLNEKMVWFESHGWSVNQSDKKSLRHMGTNGSCSTYRLTCVKQKFCAAFLGV